MLNNLETITHTPILCQELLQEVGLCVLAFSGDTPVWMPPLPSWKLPLPAWTLPESAEEEAVLVQPPPSALQCHLI